MVKILLVFKMHKSTQPAIITLFRSITMLCEIDSVLSNIFTFKLNVKNSLQNIVSPT